MKEVALYVNSPIVIPMFKCSYAKNYCNGLITELSCKPRLTDEDVLFKEDY